MRLSNRTTGNQKTTAISKRSSPGVMISSTIKKYSNSFYRTKFPNPVAFDISEKKKFCCLIAGNKKVRHPLELYSERIRAIRWFEKNQPGRFDLFGKGWDLSVPSYLAPFKPVLRPVCRVFPFSYSSYRGEITSKREILKRYKFSICYENARDIPGYITEKIFDCFFAGCIPVYLGASNVTDYIPERCFIDKRKFSDYPELFNYLNTMSEHEYLDYLHAIEEYIRSEKILPFGAEYFANMILTGLDS